MAGRWSLHITEIDQPATACRAGLVCSFSLSPSAMHRRLTTHVVCV